MKITVRNLGLISQAEIDLKPLTVLVGPNNAGKTWLAHLLAGVFGSYGYQEYIRAYTNGELTESLPCIETIVNDILSKGQASLDMAQFVDEQAETCINQVASFASTWIAGFLGTGKIDFRDLEIGIELADSKQALQERLAQSSINSKLGFGLDEERALPTAKKAAEDHRLLFSTSGETIHSQSIIDAIKEFVANILLQRLFQNVYAETYIFPAERTTFEKDIFKTSSRPMPWVTARFITLMETLFQADLTRRREMAQKDPFINRAIELSQILQEKILEGTLDFSVSEPGLGRELLFKPNQANASPMEISVVSSIVRGLAPLVLYLRYQAQPRDLIIIDEPEMNLHPEGQGQLIEFLAMLVQAGLHVLITTHSPYMVDHLENLITANERPEQAAKIREEFFLQNTDAFISRDQVSVYLVDKGTTTSLFQEDGHIHWDTFGDVSHKVMRLYAGLLDEPENS
jgi:energy-coupling factor transporter ATP-binding protein EcfA2